MTALDLYTLNTHLSMRVHFPMNRRACCSAELEVLDRTDAETYCYALKSYSVYKVKTVRTTSRAKA
jgi:hypothetical protein